jgi:hypothetical protein
VTRETRDGVETKAVRRRSHRCASGYFNRSSLPLRFTMFL